MGQKWSRVFNTYVVFRKYKSLFTGHISWWVFIRKSNSSSVLDPIKVKFRQKMTEGRFITSNFTELQIRFVKRKYITVCRNVFLISNWNVMIKTYFKLHGLF